MNSQTELMFQTPKIKMIHPSQLQPHPRNQEFFDDIEGSAWDQFVEDIREHGIINPIVTDIDGIIISGSQRWRAARELGFNQVPVIERYYSDEDTRIVELIYSNIHQRFTGDPNSIKMARCIKEVQRICGRKHGRPLKDEEKKVAESATFLDEEIPKNLSRTEIAELFGMGERKLRQMVKLLDLIPELQAAVEEGKLSVSAAEQILRKLSNEEQTQLVKTFGTEVLSAMTIAEITEFLPQVKQMEAKNQELESTIEEMSAVMKEQPKAVYAEDELEEARRKIEKLAEDNRKNYENFQAEKKAKEAGLKEMEAQYDRKYQQVVAMSDHIAALKRAQEVGEKLSQLDSDQLGEMKALIIGVAEMYSEMAERLA